MKQKIKCSSILINKVGNENQKTNWHFLPKAKMVSDDDNVQFILQDTVVTFIKLTNKKRTRQK